MIHPPLPTLAALRRASAVLLSAIGILTLAPPGARAQSKGLVKTLHTFTGTGQFGVTQGQIKASDGNFYGVTPDGGNNDAGLVYKLTPSGTYSVLHTFTDDDGSHLDGASPVAIIQGKDGNLYGVCELGGKEQVSSGGGGTFFKLSLGGTYTKLYDFDNGSDSAGVVPCAIVQGGDGNFYGLTTLGGSTGRGTYFRISADGKTRTLLYTFSSAGNGPGAEPKAQLIVGKDGNFYGVTSEDGATGGSGANGAIIKCTTGGSVTAVHVFANDDNNSAPDTNEFALVQGTDGNLYGASAQGGENDNGTLYQCKLDGTFKILYDFPDAATDGSAPRCTLVQAADGNLYGSVNEGFGGDPNDPYDGPGGYFQLTMAGKYTLFYKLPDNSGGPSNPYGNLTEVTPGVFFGVTAGGSAGDGEAVQLMVSPTITSALTATATVGQAFSYQITTHQTPTSYAATGLPSGLSISSTTGKISGTPTKSGTFSVKLSATNSAGTGTATLTLTVKAASSNAGTLAFGTSSYSVDEDAGSITVHVARSGGSSGAVSVVCGTTSGTAKSGTDYAGTSKTLSWASGDTAQKAFTVTINDLGISDGSTRAFTLKLSAPTGGATLGSPSTATITIKENDTPKSVLAFGASKYSVNEDAGSITVHVLRGGSTAGAVSVVCGTTAGTAKSGTDYTGTSKTLTWAAGDTSQKAFTVTIKDRGASGGNGLQFSLKLSAPTGGAILGNPATATITIN